jgi:hypothetical protein
MLWLVEADLATTGKLDVGHGTPSFFMNRGASDAPFCERSHFGCQVVAHEIEFVWAIFIGGVERGFSGRECENEPAVAGIDGHESENVAEEGAVCVSVLCVDDYVSTRDH